MAPASTGGRSFFNLLSIEDFQDGGILVEQVWFTAASWIGVALVASLISIRTGISVALVEIFLGMLAGTFGDSTRPPESLSWPRSAP